MNVIINKSKKYEKLYASYQDESWIMAYFTKEDWQILFRRLGNFVGNNLYIYINVDTFRRLGEEDHIPYAKMYVDGGPALYVITPFDVYDHKTLIKLEERTGAYMAAKSETIRDFCRQILQSMNKDTEIYDLLLYGHVDNEISYRYRNDIGVISSDDLIDD